MGSERSTREREVFLYFKSLALFDSFVGFRKASARIYIYIFIYTYMYTRVCESVYAVCKILLSGQRALFCGWACMRDGGID